MSALYRIGPFQLDPNEGTLTRDGIRIKLQDLPYRLLLALIERPGEIVTREEVRQRLWPDKTFVEFDNSLGVAIRKVREALHDDAEAPRYVETVPRRGYRLLTPVTLFEPSTTVDSKALANQVPSAAPTKVVPLQDKTEKSHSPRSLWIAAIILLLLFGATAYRFRSASHIGAPLAITNAVSPVVVRRSVAVLGFRNLRGRPEDNWLSQAFAEMLNTELAAGGTLRMISGEDVARAKRELPLSDEDSLAKTSLERLRLDPGADVVVLGSYTPLSGKSGEKRIRLDVRLQTTRDGETLIERAFVGSESDLFQFVGDAGATLRQSLGTNPSSPQVSAEAKAALPENPLAVRLYVEGKERLWAFDYGRAKEILTQAIAADPGFPLSHAALSDAWNHLDFPQKARAEAERARSLAGRLTLENRLLIDGQKFTLANDRKRAIESYQELFTRFPDNLDYGLRLADQQRWANTEDALHTLAALRRLPDPIGGDPRIDMIEARTWANSDTAKAQAAAHRAIEKGSEEGSIQLVARSYGILCQVNEGSSSSIEINDCDRARQSYASFGDKGNEARTLNDLAGLYYQRGDLDRAEEMFREALGVFRKMGDVQGQAAASNNLGDISLSRGDLPNAERQLSAAIPGYESADDEDGIALALSDLGEMRRLRGDLALALQTYGKAKETAARIGDKRALSYALNGIGEVLVDRGNLIGAQEAYRDSLSLRMELADPAVAETELNLARLAIEVHKAGEADAAALKCREQFHHNEQVDDELLATTTLIDALLELGNYDDAAKERDNARPLAEKSVNFPARLEFALASARSEAASGAIESAQTQLRQLLNSARSHSLFGVELEVRLAMAQLTAKSGKPRAARANFLSLENAAQMKGFDLVARKARFFN